MAKLFIIPPALSHPLPLTPVSSLNLHISVIQIASLLLLTARLPRLQSDPPPHPLLTSLPLSLSWKRNTHAHTQRQMTDVCHCKRSHSGSGAVLKMCEKGEFSVSPKCELAAWKTWSILFYCELLKTASYCIWDWKGLEALACRTAAGTQLYNSHSQLLRSHPAYCYVPKALRPPPQTKHIST